MNRSPVDDFGLAVIGFFLFFGLGLAGLLILFLSARRSRSKVTIILWGIVAAALMILECVLLNALAGIGSATSTSQHGYLILKTVAAVSVVSLIVYFPLSLALPRRREKRIAA